MATHPARLRHTGVPEHMSTFAGKRMRHKMPGCAQHQPAQPLAPLEPWSKLRSGGAVVFFQDETRRKQNQGQNRQFKNFKSCHLPKVTLQKYI